MDYRFERFLDYLLFAYKRINQEIIFNLKTDTLKYYYRLANNWYLKNNEINFDKKNQYLYYHQRTWNFNYFSYLEYKINKLMTQNEKDNLDEDEFKRKKEIAKEVIFASIEKDYYGILIEY